MKVRIKKLDKNAVIPVKAHATDAGFDLVATSSFFDGNGCVVYGTGLSFEIPIGFPKVKCCEKKFGTDQFRWCY